MADTELHALAERLEMLLRSKDGVDSGYCIHCGSARPYAFKDGKRNGLAPCSTSDCWATFARNAITALRAALEGDTKGAQTCPSCSDPITEAGPPLCKTCADAMVNAGKWYRERRREARTAPTPIERMIDAACGAPPRADVGEVEAG